MDDYVAHEDDRKGLKTRHRLAILPFGCSAPRARYILLLDDAFGEDAKR